jgi:DNA polymerase I
VERGDGFRYCFAMNHVVQGTAAELLQLAIVRVDRALVHTGARMIATVHDELVLECPEADVAAVAPRVVAEMIAAYRTLFPQAPVAGLVDAGCGDSWAAAKAATLDIGGAG